MFCALAIAPWDRVTRLVQDGVRTLLLAGGPMEGGARALCPRLQLLRCRRPEGVACRKQHLCIVKAAISMQTGLPCTCAPVYCTYVYRCSYTFWRLLPCSPSCI